MPRYYHSRRRGRYENSDDEDSDNEDSDDEDSHNDYEESSDKRKTFKPRPKIQRVDKTSHGPVQYFTGSRAATYTDHNQAGVYVLKNTQTNVYYVGKSENIENRILQHRDINQAALNRETTITTGSKDDLESWERNEVLTRMYRFGMESVRGWRYTRKGELTTQEKTSARNDIMEKFDLCRRCGHNNHFANKCFAKSSAFWCKDIPLH
jgi:hypothetical protein